MRVVVLGGGVMGITTAYALAKDGHEVTVVDRQPGPARETSFANAGIVAPGHVYAWASPRAPKVLLTSLWRKDAALKMRLRADPQLWWWGMKFLANCTAERNRRNTLTKLRLCLFSRDEMARIGEETGIAYDAERRGALYIYRDSTHLRTGFENSALLRDHGLPIETADPDRCVEIEPALRHAKGRIAGGLYCPVDESGDCYVFTVALAERCAKLGVVFRWNETVRGLRAEGGRVGTAITDRGDLAGDAYVLALGSFSPGVARSAGLRLPIYPVKGYSLTVPAAADAPNVPGVDEFHLVAFARFGDRLRFTATADFAGYDAAFQPSDFAPMLAVAQDLFPDGGDYRRPSYFACLRPMTPDGPPILGRSPLSNLWLNAGQGHMGWTMACGSARIVAELVAGRVSPIDLAGLGLDGR